MKRIAMLVACLGAQTLAAGSSAADTIWEVEQARANARAGGPTNPHDAELLQRWGCLSGSRSEFCEQLRRGGKVKYRATRERR